MGERGIGNLLERGFETDPARKANRIVTQSK
jgi:hypothetical protein